MSIFHDEVEIEDMEYDDDTDMYYYPCPCGDKFQISKVVGLIDLIWITIIIIIINEYMEANDLYFRLTYLL